MTVRVPFDVNDDVAVILPPVTVPLVSVVKNAVTPFRSVAKKFVDVAFVAKRFVVVAEVKIGVSVKE